MNKKLKDFYRLIEDIDTAMFTTRRRDGRLVSRPMANQVAAATPSRMCDVAASPWGILRALRRSG